MNDETLDAPGGERSNWFESLAYARETMNDADGARNVREQWAAFLERATELTPDPARRAARALAAAQAKFEAAAPDTADELLSVAELGPLNELQRAKAARLRSTSIPLSPPAGCRSTAVGSPPSSCSPRW